MTSQEINHGATAPGDAPTVVDGSASRSAQLSELRRSGSGWHQAKTANQPPLNPARLRPAAMHGQFRMSRQMALGRVRETGASVQVDSYVGQGICHHHVRHEVINAL
jgi:hypothetical protein